MSYSPLVGVLGHRQVGKTTLLEHLSKKYFVLDIMLQKNEAEKDPYGYIKARASSWVALDECQMVPALFPELKEWVRVNKKPGQFLLSGSIRFTSKVAIKESLTGRIINLELLPFTITELEEEPLLTTSKNLMESEGSQTIIQNMIQMRSVKKRHALIKKYFSYGGLPGICFIRDPQMRLQKIKDYLDTMLDRDLRLVKGIQLSLTDIKAVTSALAQAQGAVVDYTVIQRQTGVSTPTIKKIIFALEAIFILRTLPIQGSRSGFTVFFEDMAEHQSLISHSLTDIELLTHFLFTQIRAQFTYSLGEETKTFQYRTRGGAIIPFAFSNKLGTLGVLPIESPDQLPRVSGSIDSFLRAYAKSKVLVVHFDSTVPAKEVKNRVILAPAGQVV